MSRGPEGSHAPRPLSRSFPTTTPTRGFLCKGGDLHWRSATQSPQFPRGPTLVVYSLGLGSRASSSIVSHRYCHCPKGPLGSAYLSLPQPPMTAASVVSPFPECQLVRIQLGFSSRGCLLRAGHIGTLCLASAHVPDSRKESRCGA